MVSVKSFRATIERIQRPRDAQLAAHRCYTLLTMYTTALSCKSNPMMLGGGAESVSDPMYFG